jgi:heme/copper-type cytochrome/quinol oxidase subunit 2
MERINWRRVIITAGIIMAIMIFGFLGVKFWYKKEMSKMSKEFEKPRYPGGLRAEDLKKIPVPEPGQKFQEGIAVPKESIGSAPEVESKLRIFEVKGENGVIFPVNFRAYQNDIINIKLTAVDQDYDFSLEGYNLQVKAKKGEIKTIEFQALNLGVYNFYCSLCSTKEKPAGKIIIVPK